MAIRLVFKCLESLILIGHFWFTNQIAWKIIVRWKLEKDPLAFIQPNSPRPEENLGDDIDLSGDIGSAADIKTEIKKEAEDLLALSKHQVDLKEMDDKSVPDLKSSETEKSDSVQAVQHLPLDAKLLPIPAIVAESSLNEGTC